MVPFCRPTLIPEPLATFTGRQLPLDREICFSTRRLIRTFFVCQESRDEDCTIGRAAISTMLHARGVGGGCFGQGAGRGLTAQNEKQQGQTPAGKFPVHWKFLISDRKNGFSTEKYPLTPSDKHRGQTSQKRTKLTQRSRP